MRLTLAIIVLHIVHRSKRRLNRQVVPLIARIGDRSTNSSSDDIGLAVLKKEKTTPVNNRSIAFRFIPTIPVISPSALFRIAR